MRKIIIYISILFIVITVPSFAHSGGTDSQGGHYNRSTGEYHFHHGYPAHQHPGGICPYEIKNEVYGDSVKIMTNTSYVDTKQKGGSKSSSLEKVIIVGAACTVGYCIGKKKK